MSSSFSHDGAHHIHHGAPHQLTITNNRILNVGGPAIYFLADVGRMKVEPVRRITDRVRPIKEAHADNAYAWSRRVCRQVHYWLQLLPEFLVAGAETAGASRAAFASSTRSDSKHNLRHSRPSSYS